jgi:predicted anti-sigma-YlaC factor YlaD
MIFYRATISVAHDARKSFSESLPRILAMNRRILWPPFLALALATSGCTTLRHTAVNQLGDALANGGTAYASDDDPELIRAASPFSLKLIESLLAETPQHRGLLLAAARGFTQYGYAFVQQDADELEATDVAGAAALRARARRLYLRARDYGLRGLAVSHPDFSAALARDPRAAARACTADDVALLYWTAASWSAAIAVTKDRPDLIAELPQAEALIDRALELDESFDVGAIHSFLIAYEMARAGAAGDPAARARTHYERALTLAGGHAASPLVAYAESVCLPQQDRAQFESLLRAALALDPDAQPDSRLANLVLQRRARWLLSRTDDLFLADPAVPEKP